MAERILVVDDEPDMLALMKMIIEGATDHEVLVTNNPLEVPEILSRERVSVVITDLKMPGMDGIELLGEVTRRDESIVVLVITAYGSIESADEALNRGAFDFITKPFRKEQIVMSVEKALKWREMVRQNRELKQKLESTRAAGG